MSLECTPQSKIYDAINTGCLKKQATLPKGLLTAELFSCFIISCKGIEARKKGP